MAARDVFAVCSGRVHLVEFYHILMDLWQFNQKYNTRTRVLHTRRDNTDFRKCNELSGNNHNSGQQCPRSGYRWQHLIMKKKMSMLSLYYWHCGCIKSNFIWQGLLKIISYRNVLSDSKSISLSKPQVVAAVKQFCKYGTFRHIYYISFCIYWDDN